MRYTVTALTEYQEGIENIRSALLRHGIDLRSISIIGPRHQGRGAANAAELMVSVTTNDPAEVERIKAALAASEASDIRISEAVEVQAQARWQ